MNPEINPTKKAVGRIGNAIGKSLMTNPMTAPVAAPIGIVNNYLQKNKDRVMGSISSAQNKLMMDAAMRNGAYPTNVPAGQTIPVSQFAQNRNTQNAQQMIQPSMPSFSSPRSSSSSYSSSNTAMPMFKQETPEERAMRNKILGYQNEYQTASREISDRNDWATLEGATGLKKVYQDEMLGKTGALSDQLKYLQGEREMSNKYAQQDFENRLKQQAFNLSVQKANAASSGSSGVKLTTKQKNDLANRQQILAEIQNMRNKFSDGNIKGASPFGRLSAFIKDTTGIGRQEGVENRSTLGNLGSVIMQERSGASVPAAEMKRLEPLLTSQGISDSANIGRLKALEDYFMRSIGTLTGDQMQNSISSLTDEELLELLNSQQ